MPHNFLNSLTLNFSEANSASSLRRISKTFFLYFVTCYLVMIAKLNPIQATVGAFYSTAILRAKFGHS